MSYADKIELTNLKSPSAKEIELFVGKANALGYAGVCLQPGTLSIAAKVRRPDLKLITVAGFPPIAMFPMLMNPQFSRALAIHLGKYNVQEVENIKRIIDTGLADELDLVFPIQWYATGKIKKIYRFLSGVKKRFKKPVKVIGELGTLIKSRINLYEVYCLIADSGADYYKTNTGLLVQDFNTLTVSYQHLQLLISDMGLPRLKMKASGGIRTEEQINALLKLGVDRIGTSSITPTAVVEGGQKNETNKGNPR